MGKVSKKTKNFRKAQQKVTKKSRSGQTAKKSAKAKKTHQIRHAESVKQNKRKAKEHEEKSVKNESGRDQDSDSDEDALSDVENVDDLLESNLFSTKDAEDGADSDAADSDDDMDIDAVLRGDESDDDSDDEERLLGKKATGDTARQLLGGGQSASTKSAASSSSSTGAKRTSTTSTQISGDGAANETFEGQATDLEQLKAADPEFYKFLVENDTELLNTFSAAPGAGGDDGPPEGGAARKQADATASSSSVADENLNREQTEESKQLTMERWTLISGLALEKKSFPNLRAVIGAYRSVVQTLKGGSSLNSDFGDKKETSKRKKRRAEFERRTQERKGVFQVDDENVCQAVLTWTASHMAELLDHHLLGTTTSTAAGAQQHVAEAKKWPKLKAIARIFLCESLTYLRSTSNPAHLTGILLPLQNLQMQKYLWPFRQVRMLYLKTVAGLWSLSGQQKVRESAFLFLRNACALPSQLAHKKQKNNSAAVDQVDASAELEKILQRVIRAFTDAAKRGYSWREVSKFRFLENCVVELLKLDERTAFRITFASIRQMATVVRNSTKADCSQMGQITKEKQLQNQKSNGKLAKKKANMDKKVSLLYNWCFVRSMYLFSKVVCRTGFKSLQQNLAHPLCKVIQLAMESRAGCLNFFPYVYHCLRCLNFVQHASDQFVPVCDRLLQLLQRLLEQLDKAASFTKVSKESSMLKPVELDVTLRISDAHKNSMAVLEGCVRDLKFLFVETMGVMARSPGFPEISHPVSTLIKKLTKSARNKVVRKDFTHMLQSIEASCNEGRQLRQKFTSIDDKELVEKFAVFEENEVSLAKWRKELLQERATVEKARVEMETSKSGVNKDGSKKRTDGASKDGDSDEENVEGMASKVVGHNSTQDDEPKSKRALKRQRQKAKKLAAEQDGQDGATSAKKQRTTAKGSDVVEVADFSSDSEN
ncbi:unnamed protein product [Amoebophrya sp. A120]|nr:unnamed protein product [Amoebophrya sp. A120]|eukprot:GSA120T00022986001.1